MRVSPIFCIFAKNRAMKRLLLILAICLMGIGCTDTSSRYDSGVSWELAQWRKATIKNLRYELMFDLVENRGTATLLFEVEKPQKIVIDFRNTELVTSVEGMAYSLKNEHIIIPKSEIESGENSISIEFCIDNQSLNRQKEFLYTLLVPDRARTLFPCFDQPDLKASYTLTLRTPKNWIAVSNTAVESEEMDKDCRTIKFKPTEPLSTYLFSFVAGELESRTYDDGRHTFTAYYRESDPKRLAQLDTIFEQVAASLDWLEAYTGIKYPFAKYDLIILPGFQYGGMEHTGATLYNDTQMFLSENPTLDEELRRTKLITHETAHMWFGDYVTMQWFDDVWTKEVFANYFAARMTEPLFPDINHMLNRMKVHTSAAMSEDRTEGSTSIRQPLDNLSNAGLIYGQTIYNKAPVVMGKLVEIMGEERFREGIQEYLTTYAYSNATWDDLIAILDKRCDEDLATFSDVWVNRRGMPHISLKLNEGKLHISECDALGRGLHWPQSFSVDVVAGNTVTRHEVVMRGEEITLEVGDAEYVIPNSDGRGYGLFILDDNNRNTLLNSYTTISDEVARQATIMNLRELYEANYISNEEWLSALITGIIAERNALIASTLCGYIAEPLSALRSAEAEAVLYALSQSHALTSCRQQLLRMLMQVATSPDVCNKLYLLWHEASHPLLNINDYMTLSYELSLRFPERYDTIVTTQRERIADEDRRRKFDFIIRAVNPSVEAQERLFEELLEPENRRIEPWTATTISYLSHPLRDKESAKYIYRGLDELSEVQRTGDIFFPRNWVGALLENHRTREAYDELKRWLSDNPDYPQLLRNKILQAAHPLLRVQQ